MALRSAPYQHHPPQHWDRILLQLQEEKLFLVDRPGPLRFILKSNNGDEGVFKIMVGDKNICSCGLGFYKKKLCVHLVFTLVKILKVKTTNSLAWQLGLLEREITEILSMNTRDSSKTQTSSKRSYLKKGGGATEQRSLKKAERKLITNDDICVICYDFFEAEKLCYCQASCGTNFHINCIQMYATFQRSNNKPVTCPLCRSKWIKVPSTRIQVSKPTLYGFSCNGTKCNRIVANRIYRCIECNFYNLCERCFDRKDFLSMHSKCHFVESETKVRNWKPIQTCNYSKLPPVQSVIEELSYREINDLDYDLLLSLDNNDNDIPSLESHLLSTCKEAAKSDEACIVCSIASMDETKQLPCKENHTIHSSCFMKILNDTKEKNANGSIAVKCPICLQYLFPNLLRTKVSSNKKKIASTCEKSQTEKNLATTDSFSSLSLFGSSYPSTKQGKKNESRTKTSTTTKDKSTHLRSNIKRSLAKHTTSKDLTDENMCAVFGRQLKF